METTPPTLPVSADTTPTFWQRHGQKAAALALWIVAIAAYVIYTRANNLTLAETLQQLAATLSSPVGPILYIVIYALRPILLFSAAALTIAAGAIFGPIGILYTIIGANASAMVAYLIGRYFGDGLLQADTADDSLIARYANRMRDNSFETVFIMRLIFLPYDLVNYVSGFLRIDWRAFLLATALGSIAGTISFTLLGASLTLEQALNGDFSVNPWTLAVSVLLFVVSLAISRLVKRREAAPDAA